MKTEPTAVIPAFARMTVIGKINALPKIIKLENLTLVGRLKWQKQNIPHGSMENILMGQ